MVFWGRPPSPRFSTTSRASTPTATRSSKTRSSRRWCVSSATRFVASRRNWASGRGRRPPRAMRPCGCNLLAKDPVFQVIPVHASVLPIVEQLLDRGCLLSGMTAIDIGPGEHPQPMHGDDIVMSRHLQRPHAPMMVTSMWALTDFTAANGGTCFVPGSHRWAQTPEQPGALDDVEVQALEMAAGSVMVFHGSLWHGGGATTTTDEWRCGVNVQYCPGFVRQQQN